MSGPHLYIKMLFASLLLASSGIAQTAGKFKDAVLEFTKRLDGGAYTFERIERRFLDGELQRDTVTVLFYHRPQTDSLQFFIKSKHKIISYIDNKYGITDLANHRFDITSISQAEALWRVNSWYIPSLMNRGESIRRNLALSGASITELDTVILDKPFYILRINHPHPIQLDSNTYNLNITYVVDKDSVIRSTIETSYSFNTNFLYQNTLINWSFTPQTIQTVQHELSNYHHGLDSLGFLIINEEAPVVRERPKLLVVGTTAPPIMGRTIKSGKIDIQKLPAKLYLLEFSFASCEPCLRMAAVLERIHQEYGNKGLAVISLNPIDDLQTIENLSKRLNTSYLHLQISPETDDNYHVSGYPTIYLLDSNFRILATFQGFGSNTESDVRKKIESSVK